MKFVLGRVENTVGKGENAGDQHFLLFLQCFKRSFAPHCEDIGLFSKGLISLHFVLDQINHQKEYESDDDLVGIRSLRAQGIYSMNDWREVIT